MIVTDTRNLVVGSSHLIERVDEEGEIALIKVWTDNLGVGYYYIGATNRNNYPIYNDPDLLVPDPSFDWYYDGTTFTEVPSPTQSGPTQSGYTQSNP
jgi:hypothetical protein